MKHLTITIVAIAAFATGALAQEASSPFSASLELSSKYMWRGQEYGTAPVLFPTVGYEIGGFSACATGAYTVDGSFSECDLSLGYEWKGLSFSLVDYYYPTAVGLGDEYFKFGHNETGHALEATLSYYPEALPVWAMAGTYFYGADKNSDGDQAYSTYFEVGYYHNFTTSDELSLTIGASAGKGLYTAYKDSFGLVNLALKYSKTIKICEFEIPVSGSYIINPYIKKSFLTFSVVIGI